MKGTLQRAFHFYRSLPRLGDMPQSDTDIPQSFAYGKSQPPLDKGVFMYNLEKLFKNNL